MSHIYKNPQQVINYHLFITFLSIISILEALRVTGSIICHEKRSVTTCNVLSCSSVLKGLCYLNKRGQELCSPLCELDWPLFERPSGEVL